MNPLTTQEGLFVLHLFYSLNRGLWAELSEAERKERTGALSALVDEARNRPQTQVITLSMLAKADLGFMIISPDLQSLNSIEKKLSRVLGHEILLLEYSFFSMTEQSEYTTSEAEYLIDLASQGITPESPVFNEKIEAFRMRIKHYTHDRMYPKLPDWEFFCFYPMLKRRDGADNWYSLDFAKRKELMKGHATVGRKYSGKVLQLITGATGLDDWEWGVTLFAHDPFQVKAIVYEMRFDEVSARYGEFGDFYTGLPLALEAITDRLGII